MCDMILTILDNDHMMASLKNRAHVADIFFASMFLK